MTTATETTSPLIERLRQRTSPGLAQSARRAKLYNHPRIWFVKPDGDVVLLPGDPQNRAYYEDKGYSALRPDEVREWEQQVRPAVVADQRERAGIITTLREMAQADPTLKFVADFEVMSTSELREFLEDVARQTGRKITVVRGRTRDEVGHSSPDDLSGASLADGEELAQKMARGAGRRS